MTADARAQQAREHHREVERAKGDAAQHRAQRDDLVRKLRAENPGQWTYGALAKAVGCSRELIAVIVRTEQ
jgi:hypothetical protein